MIIKTLQKQNKPMTLAPADLVKLQQAGVSENIIGVMMDPGSAPAAAAAAAPPPPAAVAPPPTAAATAPPPVEMNTVAATNNAVTQAQKKRVIVDEFDFSTVSTAVQQVFGTKPEHRQGHSRDADQASR